MPIAPPDLSGAQGLDAARPEVNDQCAVTVGPQQACTRFTIALDHVGPGASRNAKAAPGPRECRYCDVPNCPYRHKKPSGDASPLW